MHDVSPDVTVRGPGEAVEVAVVGGVHGDEPSGVRAIERVLDDDPELDRRVAFVAANPPAIEADQRYLDVDMNRVLPGDPDAEERERRLAATVCDLVHGLPTLSLHSTHSQPEPMALVSRERPRAQALAAELPTEYVVDETGAVDGALTECGSVVTVEAGCQGTDAATDAAERFVRAFLQATGALDGDPPDADPTFYELDGTVEKPAGAPEDAACSDLFTLHAENFRRVEAGERWATVDGEDLVADEPFVPILMSECGYQDVFGYRGSAVGESLAAAQAAWDVVETPDG